MLTETIIEEISDLEFESSDEKYCHLAWPSAILPAPAFCGAPKWKWCNVLLVDLYARQVLTIQCSKCDRPICLDCIRYYKGGK